MMILWDRLGSQNAKNAENESDGERLEKTCSTRDNLPATPGGAVLSLV
jgi:hypothetical protein